MNLRGYGFPALAGLVVAAQAALALGILAFGPTTPIPLHFGWDGQPDRWGGRGEAAAAVAVMAAVAALVAFGLDAASRRKGDGMRSLKAAKTLGLVVTSMISALFAALVFVRLPGGPAAPMLQMAFLSGLFALVGAWLGKVGPNALVGVRTPWTFASRLAWDKANRLAGRLFFWVGMAGLVAAPFAPQPAGMRAVMFAVLAAAGASVFESWRIWRTDPDRRAAN